MDTLLVVVTTAVLVGLSAIFSGLNIALMSMSTIDLRRKSKLGNREARRVYPLRKNSNLTLPSILFGNVAAVAASSLVLESYLNGIVAGIVTTLLMVVFGEVLPQVIFVRYALKFCSTLTPLMYLAIIVTYPASRLMQWALDRLVSSERHSLHSRDELGLIIGEHRTDDASELDDDEVEIIQSALLLSEKQVKDIMTPIKEVFWLTIGQTLDAKTVDTIKDNGYSRVPVFDKRLTQCYGVLLMKDMVDIDFDDEPRPLASFTLHKTRTVGSRTALDTMLRKFFGNRSHLVPVEKDDKIIGIVTVEDLIEEIVGHEITDETDQRLDRE